uniref:CD109 molecule n=1 Tax=Erpetoichthys calabaricus TaxID=27687 RepID=A0A8C4RNQ4_ERPCA
MYHYILFYFNSFCPDEHFIINIIIISTKIICIGQQIKQKYCSAQRVILVNTHKPICNIMDLQDPSSNIVQQWISEKGNLGVVSKTYRLTDNSLLGSWAIQVTINVSSIFSSIMCHKYLYSVVGWRPVRGLFPALRPVLLIYFLFSMLFKAKRPSTVNKSVNIINAEYNLEFIQKPTVLRPSLNFTTYLKISFYDGQPLSEEEIGRNVTFSISQSLFSNSWRAFQMTESVQIQNIQSEIPKNGIIKLEFPLDINITSLTIKANFSGAEQTLSVFNVLNSPSHSYLKLHVESLHIKVTVLSKGNTILAGNSSATSFSLTATYSWAPVASVLVYYVRDDGEVVGDQVQISITNIFQNKVNLSWSNKHVQPSNAVSLQVNVTEPNSFVGILVVDKSAKLLGDANDLSEDMVSVHFQVLSNEVFHATDKNLPESPSTETKPIRSNFPETWIWNVTYTGASTTVNLDVVAPDTITSWIASAFVMSENLGLGLTSFSEELVVFQSFFISLNLPYSVIRGEELVLDVILFNYLNQSIEVMVTVTPSDDFQFVISLNDTTMLPNRQKVYIPSQEGAAAKFPVRPIKLGVIPITVHAAFSKSSDTVIEKILVKVYSFSFMYNVCLTNKSDSNLFYSSSFFINHTGDIMGPSISGLEYLIQMPCGCGEQNMIMFAPNIYVIQYLMNTKQKNAENIRNKLCSMLITNKYPFFLYSRLSAFVLKCFLQARPFIFIDPMVLEKTTAWLVKQQNFNGAFNEPGRVIHTELQGGHNGPITLTAYVLINVYKMEILSAVSYLENRYLEGISDNYTLSILTYALSLAKSHNASNALIELNRRADKRGGSMFWSSPPIGQAGWWQPRSSDIELAAYALLSHYTQVKITEGALVMKWLSQQRNHLGGYSSTQDTVIALQALSQFAANYSSSNTSLNVSVDIAGTEEPIMFRINSENLLVLYIIFITSEVNIFFNIKSQVASRRRRDADLNEAFELDVNVFDSLGDIDHLHLNICTRFIENQYTNKTGMAMMEVGLLSGFMVDQDAIPTDNLIKKVEVDFQKVNIYLDSLNTLMICLKIPQRRMFSTASSQDATVVVYDYYEPGK